MMLIRHAEKETMMMWFSPWHSSVGGASIGNGSRLASGEHAERGLQLLQQALSECRGHCKGKGFWHKELGRHGC